MFMDLNVKKTYIALFKIYAQNKTIKSHYNHYMVLCGNMFYRLYIESLLLLCTHITKRYD